MTATSKAQKAYEQGTWRDGCIDYALDAEGERAEQQDLLVAQAESPFWIQLLDDYCALRLFKRGDETVIGGRRYRIAASNPNGTYLMERLDE